MLLMDTGLFGQILSSYTAINKRTLIIGKAFTSLDVTQDTHMFGCHDGVK